MAIRVLIINRQLVFAVTLKQALEQTGLFDVHPFTTADTAFDFLRDHPQDVALVDFTLPGRSGAKIIQQLRSIQSDLAVIISPRQPDADVLMKSLRLQGMIDMPFGARDVIPLIERAVEQAQQMPPGSGEPPPLSSEPPAPQTHILGEDPPAQPGQITTKILGEEQQLVRKQFGTTRLFDEAPEPPEESPEQTRNLDESPNRPAQTRQFEADEYPPSNLYPDQMPDRDEDEPRIKPLRRDVGQTQDLSDVSPIKPLGSPEPTSGFDDFGDEPRIKPLRPPIGQTRDLSGSNPDDTFDAPRPPSRLPEMSSLESVLQSFGFDAPVAEDDTPAVPTSDSDALRQFLATADHGTGGADQFDGVLGAIDPSEIDDRQREDSPFEGLVKSMQRTDEPHRTLPNRQEKLMDFILTSGMDAVLREIEHTKTGPLESPPSTIPEEPSIPQPKPKTKPKDLFQRLAEEEPPRPTFEESGTVGDLMLGVSDSGFRNVLSLLRGDEADVDEEPPPRPERRTQARDPFAEFFAPPPGVQETISPPVQEPSPSYPAARPDTYQFDDYPNDEEAKEATVAQVILQTALEDAQLPDGFSLNQLLSDIENRLSLHKLAVKPLPSWNMDTGVFRPVSEAEIREPDFLPEELPPGEVVGLDALLEFDEPESYTGRTTRASLSNQITRATTPEDEDTLFDARILDDTASSKPVEPEFEVVEDRDAVEPDWLSETPPPVNDDRVDDTAPTGTFGDDESADVDPIAQDDEAWNQEPQMEDGASFLAPLLKGVPPQDFEQMPVSEEDDWDIQIEPEEVDDQEVISAEVDWTLESGAESLWGIPNEAEFEIPDSQEETSEEWVLETGAEEQWGIPQQSEAPAVEIPSEFTQDDWALAPEADEDAWDIPIESGGDTSAAQTAFTVEDDWATEFEAEAAWDIQSYSENEEPASPQVMQDEWELPAEGVAQRNIPEDPYIAQLALNLTQFSLESSSEGSILTRDGEIVAYSGHLSTEDTLELRDVINNDWDANPEGARIRFITLPSSGKDYMLYSIRTDADLVLSMIFAGTTPLRVIRQQGHRLMAALESIPEKLVDEAPPEAGGLSEPDAMIPVQAVSDEPVRNAHTYVWLLQDNEGELTDAMAQAMMAGLNTQLSERGWKINALQIHEDFVYLFADVPGDNPSHEIMRDLKRRSAEIAHAQNLDITPQMLWADAYFVLTPGRELQIEEIQEFINFQRMA